MTAIPSSSSTIRVHARAIVALVLLSITAAGCGGTADIVEQKAVTPTVRACCSGGGILPEPVNSVGNDYAAFIERRGTEDHLWFTSSRAIPGRKPTILPAEMFHSRRSIDAPSMVTSWSTPLREVPIDPVFDTWTRGAVAINGDVMILAAEQPLDLATPFTPGGTSYHLYLWQLTRDASGRFVNPVPLDRVNSTDWWTSQPALSPDGRTLLFVSNRPNPNDPQDTSQNIWRSTHTGSGWSEPVIVPQLSTRGDDVTPSIDAQGNVHLASNWDFRSGRQSTSGFDLWYAGPLSALVDGSARPVKNLNELTNMEGCKSPCKYDVNTAADEISPFLFTTPTGRHLVYSSNQPGGYGGYDIYACMMPAPCVRIKPVVLCFEGGAAPTATHDVKGREMVGEALLMDQAGETREVLSGQVVDVKPGVPVTFTHESRPKDCERMVCKPVTIVPELTDEIRTVEVTCDCTPPTLETILISDASGIPYFITGYWQPNNSKNHAEFLKLFNGGKLNGAKFINPHDYDYACAAKAIDRFFEANVYAKIGNALRTVENCTNHYSLMITVVGFTDACGLSAGRYVGPDIEFGNLLIPNGQEMWAPTLKEKGTGRNVPLRERGQVGNVILSMLRAHYTMKTIDEEMMTRSEEYRRLKGENRIFFNLEGMGIYSTDLWRSTEVPAAVSSSSQCQRGSVRASAAACNNPEGRRIEIYVKQIQAGGEKEFTKPFETDFIAEEVRDPSVPVPQCDCFRMEYAFDNRADCEYTKSVIESFGKEKLPVALTIEERVTTVGRVQFILVSECLKTREQANTLGANAREATSEASRILTKSWPQTDPACALYRLSFGTFRYARNAETLADRLQGVLGTEMEVESVFDPVQNVKVFAVHSGHFKTQEAADQALADAMRRLREARISVKGRVVL